MGPGRVHLSDATYELLLNGNYEYEFEERNIEIDGYEDVQRTWFVKKGNCKAAQSVQRHLIQQRRNSISKSRPYDNLSNYAVNAGAASESSAAGGFPLRTGSSSQWVSSE